MAKKRANFFLAGNDLSAQKGRMIISIKRESNITPSQLAHKFSLTRATVTQQIKELEQEGFIKKISDNEDKRKIHLGLTPKGKEKFKQIDKNITKIEKDISSIYTKEEQKQFDELLTKGINHFKEITKGANN